MMTIEEIEKQWPYPFPLDHTKGELRDQVIAANYHIDWLIQEVKKLEAKIHDPEWCCAEHKKELVERIKSLDVDLALNAFMLAKQTDLAREAETRIMELMNGIKKHRDILHGPGKPWMWGGKDEDVNHRLWTDEELYRLVEGK